MRKNIPFFYIIENTKNGKLYAGSKVGVNANPKEFMTKKGYKTSSKIIKTIIENFGLDIFKIRKLRTFSCPLKAYNYETKFLLKVDARNNPKFYNRCNNE